MSDDGLLVVDKPAGWTSHQVVGRCRRILGTRKVGHAGTLDPMATGVLVVGVNRATRLLGHLALHDKRYLATIRLGVETLTEDADGEVTATAGSRGVSPAAVAEAMGAFRGRISQVPSAVSAIKVGGVRSYARVRAGQDVTLAARTVNLTVFELLATRAVEAEGIGCLDVDVAVECSSGTYVRALARDLGHALGTGGHLTALRRTRVGGYDLTDVGVDVTAEQTQSPALMSMAEAASRSFPVVTIDEGAATAVTYGQALDLSLAGLTGLIGPSGALLALYRPQGGRAVPEAVLTDAGGGR